MPPSNVSVEAYPASIRKSNACKIHFDGGGEECTFNATGDTVKLSKYNEIVSKQTILKANTSKVNVIFILYGF